MIRILVNGAKGKMGREAVKAISAEKGLKIVAELDLGDDLPKGIRESEAEVVVDFTVATSAFENARLIIESGARPVIGTSGLTLGQVEELQALSSKKSLGGLIAPNFAIGAVLMMKFAAEAARYLPHAEIIELHHDEKPDAPSGTARKTAQLIADVRREPSEKKSAKEPPARGEDVHGVRVHSVRLPGLVAHQEVLFGGKGQTLSIRHDSLNRESFMPGVVLACRKVMELDHLVYGLEHVL